MTHDAAQTHIQTFAQWKTSLAACVTAAKSIRAHVSDMVSVGFDAYGQKYLTIAPLLTQYQKKFDGLGLARLDLMLQNRWPSDASGWKALGGDEKLDANKAAKEAVAVQNMITKPALSSLPLIYTTFDYMDILVVVLHDIRNNQLDHVLWDQYQGNFSQAAITELDILRHEFRTQLIYLETGAQWLVTHLTERVSDRIMSVDTINQVHLFDSFISSGRHYVSTVGLIAYISLKIGDVGCSGSVGKAKRFARSIRQMIMFGTIDTTASIKEEIEFRKTAKKYHPIQRMGVTFNLYPTRVEAEPVTTGGGPDTGNSSEEEDYLSIFSGRYRPPPGNRYRTVDVTTMPSHRRSLDRYKRHGGSSVYGGGLVDPTPDLVVDVTLPQAQDSIRYDLKPIIDLNVALRYGPVLGPFHGLTDDILRRFQIIKDVPISKTTGYKPDIHIKTTHVHSIGMANDRMKTVLPASRMLYDKVAMMNDFINVGAGPRRELLHCNTFAIDSLDKPGARSLVPIAEVKEKLETADSSIRQRLALKPAILTDIILARVREWPTTCFQDMSEFKAKLVSDTFISDVATEIYGKKMQELQQLVTDVGQVCYQAPTGVLAAEVQTSYSAQIVEKVDVLKDILQRITIPWSIAVREGYHTGQGQSVAIDQLQVCLEKQLHKFSITGAAERKRGIDLSFSLILMTAATVS
jgi:hypothetical protein